MRILFSNLLSTATLSAGGTSVNYPLANLQHVFLKRKFQQLIASVSDANALTLTWASDQTIDTILVGYTNGKTFTLKLYNTADTLLSTVSFTDTTYGSVFTAISGVRKAKLLIDDNSGDSPMTVYLGGLGIGLSYQMPDPDAEWDPGMVDNSFGEVTIDGQVSAQYIEPLRTLKYAFEVYEKEDFDEIYSLVAGAGRLTPVWVAPFENALTFEKPIYATCDFEPGQRKPRSYPFTLTLQEAR